ncbi:hypothetical protein ACFPOI_00605 [Nonomuraea angiospora]|uniref:MarR family transcriptional regulator n=1 Tax=Nonomuraea angiospora TaxID=46172 RepID=A0ABR9M335_9ACTN|nr:hypothetical protein [Nonomuraea angiospora]MBE1586903.1 hypothetical protein [Nonomuraea angiospora]
MRAHGSEGRGLSSGAMDLLLRLSDADDGGVSIGEPAQSAGVSPRNAMAAIFRGFSPEELTSLRHLCLRLAEHLAAQEAR